MSFILRLSSLSKDDRLNILKTFTVKQPETRYKPVVNYRCFLVNETEDSLHLPIGKWKDYIDIPSIDGNKIDSFSPNGDLQSFPTMNKEAEFTKSLFTVNTDPDKRNRDQDIVVDLALQRLRREGTVFIASFTGFGKMALGIYLSIALGLKTIIICHLDVVRKQWPDEYKKLTCNVKVQLLEGKSIINNDADVYIVGIQKAINMCDSIDNLLAFRNIGTVIIDEAHIATVTAFTKALLYFHPFYLIGLSATPDRNDGLHSIFDLYFGEMDEFITRNETKNFTVYKYLTEFKPEVKMITVKGKVVPDWNRVIESIEEDPKVWERIANIAIKHPKEKIIILCDRKILSIGVYEYLIDKKEDAELLIGDTKVWNKDARILVAGFKKGGVGLNDPKLTMAIIASDTSDVRQYEGRIRTTDNIIYHVVHNYKPFENHWSPCQEWYSQKGADIKIIDSVSGEEVKEEKYNTNDKNYGNKKSTRFLPPMK